MLGNGQDKVPICEIVGYELWGLAPVDENRKLAAGLLTRVVVSWDLAS